MDLRALAQDSSPMVRADLAVKISSGLTEGTFTSSEAAIAGDILRLLVTDIEVQVRRAIAQTLKASRAAPHEIILKLASDVQEVALPVLQYSYVLSEEDLIAIVRSTREVAKLSAIARRESISAPLSHALVETGEHKVLHTLLHNRGAVIEEATLESCWGSIAGNSTLLEALVQRGGLSVTIAERLFTVVTDELKIQLARQYKLPLALVEESAEDLREWSTLGMLMPDRGDAQNEQEVEALVHQLYTGNRLTYSMVIRALCTGDLVFFEAAMARLAGVPRANARILMFDSGPHGFSAFYKKAHMPEGFYEAIRVMLRISLELTAYGRVKREDFRRRVVERIHAEGHDRSVENMQYLLTIVGGNIGAAQTLH